MFGGGAAGIGRERITEGQRGRARDQRDQGLLSDASLLGLRAEWGFRARPLANTFNMLGFIRAIASKTRTREKCSSGMGK